MLKKNKGLEHVVRVVELKHRIPQVIRDIEAYHNCNSEEAQRVFSNRIALLSTLADEWYALNHRNYKYRGEDLRYMSDEVIKILKKNHINVGLPHVGLTCTY
jgi:hypothetical protein